MTGNNIPGLQQFLEDFPGMSLAPSRNRETILKGLFEFSAQPVKSNVKISDFYRLQIIVPITFPKKIPKVIEIDQKIRRDGEHHVNYDNTLCLGSPLRTYLNLSQNPTLVGFANNCLIPYLYAISYKRDYKKFPFGDLAHGESGVIADYLDLFGLENPEQVKKTLLLLGMKKRIANKKPCPCDCSKRLGSCSFHYRINVFRKLAPRSWFNYHLNNLGKGI